MKGKPAIASFKYVVNDFMSDRTVLRLEQDKLWLVQ